MDEELSDLVVEIPERKASLMTTGFGIVQTEPTKARKWVIPSNRGKRGNITTFSRASSANMKKKLITLPDYKNLYGLTFTLNASAWDGDTDKIRKFWNRFSTNLRHSVIRGNLFRYCYYIWRIELQQNKTPHWHCLFSVESEADILEIRRVYRNQVKRDFGYEVAPEVCCDVIELESYDSAYAYMASHNTKHKRAQLGWQGRQWGLAFVSKHAKNRYNAHIAVYKDSIEEIKSSEDVKKAVRRVGYSQLCNIELRDYQLYKRTLRRFLFAKMRSIDKVANPLRWSPDINDKKTLKASRKDQQKVFFVKRYKPLFREDGDNGFVRCGSKPFKNGSLNWLAFRQSAQKCQFLTQQATEKLLQGVL